ncbi:class I SAM-dependent methyltransferase [Candidatus Parcubacteria bacterium]|nr:class I SAM-dependent methyltransferase [Candidatus Parcubacteria bacterium]
MKKPAYITVEEMHTHPEWLETDDHSGGTRFQGTTTPDVAFKYFTDKNGKYLECGPHLGMFAKVMLEKGYKNWYAVDFFDALKLVDRSKIDLHILDLNTEKIPYPDNMFDGVTAWGIGEHMENPFHFMREVHRVLKPGGTFIFALPNVFHIVSRLLFLKKGTFPRWNESNNHIMLFSKDTFKKTFLRFFRLEKTIYSKPGIQYLFFHIFDRFLPANEWFSNYVIYVLKKPEH